MSNESKTVWTRIHGDGVKEPVLVGRRLSREWLKGSVRLAQIRLTGETASAFGDMLEAAGRERKNLPVISLRTALIAGIDGIVTLDKDLGLVAGLGGTHPSAVEMYLPGDEDRAQVRERFIAFTRRWVMDDLEPWAARNNTGHLVARLKGALSPSHISLDEIERPYINTRRGNRPEFSLIARVIGERLIGEELFAGLGCCELVAAPEYRGNSVELMTLPQRAVRGDDVFSMVARLGVVSMPYSDEIYLAVSSAKRVWAKKAPGAFPNMPRRVNAYVMSEGRPASAVSVRRGEGGWEFGEEYAAVQREAGGVLPATLKEAIAQREFNKETGWWAGLPQLPTLFKSISPRTVFEADEIDLLHTVIPLLTPILTDKPIPMREVPFRSHGKPRQEMLRLSDFGTAGGSLLSEALGEDADETEAEVAQGLLREQNLERYRQQNMSAIHLAHGDKTPVLWVMGGTPSEQELIKDTVTTLFGDSVKVNSEALPDKTHGLRGELDHPDFTARARFEERLKRWKPATEVIQRISATQPVIALICAPDRINNKLEDPVNYYAGIHAMASIGANVHHVLPIEDADDEDSRQSFLHRVQSALLDVLLAHSGIVFGVKDFFAKFIPSDATPYAVYGVQAVRSKARSRSGETGVSFILYSRLIIDSGITEVQFVYRGATANVRTPWMVLSKGLQWLGTQRQFHEGNQRWLQESFVDATKCTFQDIAEKDPNAIVMVDWQSVAGLWPGLRDEDLGFGKPPRLGGADLSAIRTLSLVRLRRGADTVSLRGSVRTTFEGWRDEAERVPTGETVSDAYYTTTKSLVEITESLATTGRRFGHFIASMGYAKTVQVKRGFSCYRYMTRMSRIKGTCEFQQKLLEPASLDAALPAPMDITVMSTPANVAPENVASVVMGLRLGYAHYSDWTTLPAPLFFRRKIEDYIIRFPEEEEAAVAASPVVVVEEPEESGAVAEVVAEEASGPTEIARLVAEQFVAGEVSAQVDLFDSDADTGAALDALPYELPPIVLAEAEDLLSRVKRTEMPQLAPTNDKNQGNMYRRMIRGEIRVRVDLPYWVRCMGIFGGSPAVKRITGRCWDLLREFSYVKNNVPKPRTGEFMDWLADHLNMPQACYALTSVTRDMGGIYFHPMGRVIDESYNAVRPEEERLGANILTPDTLKILSRWADENRHDELMGWLVFQVTQFPSPGWVDAVISNIRSIPGPLTEEALKYYLDCAAAVADMISQKDSRMKFTPVIRRREKPLLVEPLVTRVKVAEIAYSADHVLSGQSIEKELVTQASPVIPSSTPIESDPVMAAKNELLDLIGHIQPGADDFVPTLNRIKVTLDGLVAFHERELENKSSAKEHAERLAALVEIAESLLQALQALMSDLEIAAITRRDLAGIDIDAAREELATIQEAVNDIQAWKEELETLGATPLPSSVIARAQRNQKESQMLNALMARMTVLHGLLNESLCFVLEKDGPPSPREGTTETKEEVITEVVTPVEPLPVVEPVEAARATSIETSDTPATEIAPPVKREIAAAMETGFASMTTKPVAAVSVEPLPLVAPLLKQAVAKLAAPAIQASKVAVSVEVGDAVDEGASDPFDSSLLDREAEVMVQLMQRRLYGLARVHVEAIGVLLKESNNEANEAHRVVMRALVDALDNMDCQSSFEFRLNEALKELLTAKTLPASPLCEPVYMALGILGAGLGNLIFDNSDVQWNVGNAISSRLTGHAALSGLIEHLDTIRVRGLVLTREMFAVSHVGEHRALDNEIERFKARAKDWKTAPEIHGNWNHRGFKTLHDEMFSPKGVIGQCLALISKGDNVRLKVTYNEARRKLEKAPATVDDLYKRSGEKTRPDGLFRARAIENVEATRLFIEGYLARIDDRAKPSRELAQNIQAFLLVLHKKLTDAAVEARSLKARNAVEALYCEAAITALQSVLRLFDNSVAPSCISQVKQRLLIQLPMNQDLLPAMQAIDAATPPLCGPHDVFQETRRWTTESLTTDNAKSEDDIDKALRDAKNRHMAAKRFLPAFTIDALLPAAVGSVGEPLLHQYEKEKVAFTAELQEARQKVTRAMTLNAFPQSENETNKMLRTIEELLTSVRSDRAIGHPEGGSATYPDFPHARAALRFNVMQPLETHLKEASLRLEADLTEFANNSGIVSSSDVNRIRRMLEANNFASLRSAYDALALLKQSGKLPDKLVRGADLATEYDAFMADMHRCTATHKKPLDSLKDALGADPVADDPDWLSGLNAEERYAGVTLIDAWVAMFQARDHRNQESIETLFKLIGITKTPTLFPEHARSNRAKLIFPERAFTFPTAADDSMFIPPILGSWASHIQGFILYGATQDTDMQQLSQEIGATPTVAMARINLNMQKRARISRNTPVLLIDDELIAYLALHPNDRFHMLMRIGILTFSANPYDDYGLRPVPTEMFFGRQEELNKLRDVKGLAVLFGGRRLGKSSLLSQIELEATASAGNEAVYVTMDTVNTSGDHVLSAWEFIVRALVTRKIIQPAPSNPRGRWQVLQEWVEKELVEGKKVKSLYLLIDEADALMGSEFKMPNGAIGFVKSLQQMTNNLGQTCPVRYVIAGLHNVTRMTAEENSVLGKAEAIALKPFSTPEDIHRGIRLITKPMEAMGYLFGPGSEDLPFRILSVCNFYPAFIQLYCRRLIDWLQNKRQDLKPPILITSEDLNAVENDSTLLIDLRRKFKLNLDLDKRYKAIALILADVYYTEIEGGHYQGLATPEIRDYCELYAGRHFDHTGPGVYEALLDEMRKLNVIERNGTRYVLRNPNIAMMMGDRDSVKHQMDELALEQPEATRNHGERRISMSHHNAITPFPMPVAWARRNLDTSDGELVILTGNSLSGIMNLANSDREDWRLQDGIFSIAPAVGPQTVAEQISKHRRRGSAEARTARIMAVRSNSWKVDQIPEYAALAQKAEKSNIRLMLIAQPERAYELAMAMDNGTLVPSVDSQHTWRIEAIPPWSEDAIYFQLNENVQVAENAAAIDAIKTATCGFGQEVIHLCSGSLTVAKALALPQERKAVLGKDLAAFYGAIGMPATFTAEQRKAAESFLSLINGATRQSPEVDETRNDAQITKGMMDFLYWMALLQDGPGATWMIPPIYAELIA